MLTDNGFKTEKYKYNIFYLTFSIFIPFIILLLPAYYYFDKIKHVFVLYITTEISSSVLGIAVGIICFTYFLGVRRTYFLYIGLGFMLTGIIDFLQAFFAFSKFLIKHNSNNFYYSIDVFTIDSVVLCLFFCLAPLLNKQLQKKQAVVHFIIKILVTLIIGLFIYYILIWTSMHENHSQILTNIEISDYLGLSLFIVALILNYKYFDSQSNVFTSFLIICILLNIFAELVFCISSVSLSIRIIDFRPVAKLIGNFMPIIGILLYSLDTIELAENSKKQILLLKDKLQMALQSGNVNAWSWDSVTNKIIFLNEIFSKMIDFSNNDIKEIDLNEYMDFVVAEDREPLRESMKATLDSDKSFSHDHRIKNKEGEVFYLHSIAKSAKDEETGETTKIIGLTADYTVLTKAKIEKNIALEKLNRVNAKLENYSYTISHDLKEPIRNVKYMAQFLKEDYGTLLDERGLDYLERVIKSSDKMHSMITDLLTLARIGRVEISFIKCNLTKMIYEIVQTIKSLNKDKNILIDYSEFPDVICQPTWINMIFQNLLNNAVKFNDKFEIRVKVSCQDEGDRYVFSVKDNGIGIENKLFDKVFYVFQKGHNDDNIEGHGAGLAIVKAVAKEHRGDAWVKWSKVKEGTEICFSISKKISDSH